MAKKKVRVTRKQVDAAQAEVRAFTVAGLRPDPLVMRIAEAGGAVCGTLPLEPVEPDISRSA